VIYIADLTEEQRTALLRWERAVAHAAMLREQAEHADAEAVDRRQEFINLLPLVVHNKPERQS